MRQDSSIKTVTAFMSDESGSILFNPEAWMLEVALSLGSLFTQFFEMSHLCMFRGEVYV